MGMKGLKWLGQVEMGIDVGVCVLWLLDQTKISIDGSWQVKSAGDLIKYVCGGDFVKFVLVC